MTILSGIPLPGAVKANALKLKSGWFPPSITCDSSTASRTIEAKIAATGAGTPNAAWYVAATRSTSVSIVPCMPISWMSSEEMSQKRFTSRSALFSAFVCSPP
jgi:hypothetical protein